jgi:SlyX protein
MTDEQRITELEIRFSHQDHFLKELNEVIIAQHATISRLEKEILDLKRSVNAESGVNGLRTLNDEKPPHY